jgi:predicted transcriptional regulator
MNLLYRLRDQKIKSAIQAKYLDNSKRITYLYQLRNKIPPLKKEGPTMSSDELKLTAQIVISHASMSELTPQELVEEIKAVYNVLTALEGGVAMAETATVEAEGVKKPSIPLKDIVTAKYVVCLECGKKMRTLKAHIRKAHNLMPKEYFKRFALDPKKYPLVCKEYSEQRSKMAKDRGFGVKGGRRKATS